MLAMALLLHGGLLDGMGGEAAGVDGSGEDAWTLATPAELHPIDRRCDVKLFEPR
eukprot:COSAG02_NODE_242_length_27511_cov_501.886364_10_plen_55_part_00